MGWFTKICRNAGLMIHNLKDPEGEKGTRQVVSRRVEEDKVSESVTLRRTTIEEVEVKSPRDPQSSAEAESE